jgi:hypothetical protein
VARQRKDADTTTGIAIAVEKPDGEVEVLLEDDDNFYALASAIASDFTATWFKPDRYGKAASPSLLTPYQTLIQGGTPGLRDLLTPSDKDYDGIIDRILNYTNTNLWVGRALSLRAALNAAEFNIFVPKDEKQLEWLESLCKDLKMYSSVREMFWNLRAFDQTVVLWKTARGENGDQTRALKPLSIECQDPRVVQPKGPGHTPKLYMYPHKDKVIRALSGMDRRSAEYKRLKDLYPEPILEAGRKRQALPVEQLEKYGYHFEYFARNRRDWDDTAFPTMYSIFADLEMINLAAEIDANTLHHYKAGILQFAIGPDNPTNPMVIPDGKVLKETEQGVKRQLRNRLASLFTRGDVKITWVVPPKEVLTEEKYTSAMRRVMDYIGLPRVAWAGQNAEGAYAAAVSAMKFLRAESEDDRALMKEFLESWLTGRAKSSNEFPGAKPVRVRFDPNALVEDRVILELMRLFSQAGGASIQTILDMADLDPEFEAYQRKKAKELKKEYGVDFAPEYSVTKGGSTDRGGRPNGGESPRPEEVVGPVPRVSKAKVEAIAAKIGVSPEYILDAIKEVGEESA